MRKILILTDSCSDIFDEKKFSNIRVLPLSCCFNEQKKIIFKDIKGLCDEDFYNKLNVNKQPYIMPVDYKAVLHTMLDAGKNGYDIIFIHTAKNLIYRNYDVINSARELALLSDIDMRITLIDSENLSMAQGLLALKAEQMVRDGYGYEDIVNYLEKNKKFYNLEFCLTDDEHLGNNRVISSRKIGINNLLNLKAIYSMNSKGIYVKNRVNSKSNPLEIMVEQMSENVDLSAPVVVVHSNNPSAAEFMADAIEDLGIDGNVTEFGKVNTSLLGVGALGLVYKKK